MPASPAEYLPRQRALHRIGSIPIEEETLVHLAALPPLHRDPFDRILVSQAMQHAMTVVTVDVAVKQYPIQFLA